MTSRALEPGIVTDLTNRLSYAGYLHLDRLLAANQREWAGLALKIRHIKNGIERDNNDVHRISAN